MKKARRSVKAAAPLSKENYFLPAQGKLIPEAPRHGEKI
jgi:hypothetical protein